MFHAVTLNPVQVIFAHLHHLFALLYAVLRWLQSWIPDTLLRIEYLDTQSLDAPWTRVYNWTNTMGNWSRSNGLTGLCPENGFYVFTTWNQVLRRKMRYILSAKHLDLAVGHTYSESWGWTLSDHGIVQLLEGHVRQADRSETAILDLRIGSHNVYDTLHPYKSSLELVDNVTANAVILLWLHMRGKNWTPEHQMVCMVDYSMDERLVNGDAALFPSIKISDDPLPNHDGGEDAFEI